MVGRPDASISYLFNVRVVAVCGWFDSVICFHVVFICLFGGSICFSDGCEFGSICFSDAEDPAEKSMFFIVCDALRGCLWWFACAFLLSG